MKANSLFKVVVLGGALIGTNAASAFERIPDIFELEEAESLAFCDPNPEAGTCEIDPATGKSVVKAGLTCCWGTSCDAE